MSRRLLYILVCFLCLVIAGERAPAQVVLKPNGANAVPLRTKAVNAHVAINGQFATTRLTLTFQNTTSERIEADFIYTIPAGALVTRFAYWYGAERVPARIFEKEEAAAIYSHITTRMRDPALIELIGKSTFRARIFPVMPNSDLKVEMTLVQTLPATPKGAVYRFPLATAKVGTLDSLHLTADVQTDNNFMRAVASGGAKPTRHGSETRFTLDGTNYHPKTDWTVTLLRKPRLLQAALYTEARGKADGFFALALTPNRAFARPRVRIQGVPTFQVQSPSGGLRAHQTVTIVGRYRGRGKATVILTDAGSRPSCTASVRFASRAASVPLAASLWASQRMAQLSANSGHRAEVIALSRRFGLPGRYTSWLAVPKEEMKRYEEEIAEAKIELVTSRLIASALQSGPHSPATRRLRREYNRLCSIANRDADGELENALGDTLWQTAEEIVRWRHREGAKPKNLAQLSRKLRVLTPLINKTPRQQLASAESEWQRKRLEQFAIETWQRHQTAREHLYAEHLKPTPDPQQIARWHDEYVSSYSAPFPGSRKAAEEHAELLSLHAEEAKLTAQMAKADEAARKTLEVELAAKKKRDDELRTRWGDPLISIVAPVDAIQVVAIMPGGEIKPLTWNARNHHWEVRFDIPRYATEGAYLITIVVARRGGTRQTFVLRYHVDLTPPTGSGSARLVTGTEPTLRLELEASEDTARVKAQLPWGVSIGLRATGQPGHFFGLVAVPLAYRNAPACVTYILTDKAHNRTTILVDMAQ